MEFKIGQKVRVREDLIEGEDYGGGCYTRAKGILGLRGKSVTIKHITDWDTYLLKEDKYSFEWSKEMFKGDVQTIIE